MKTTSATQTQNQSTQIINSQNSNTMTNSIINSQNSSEMTTQISNTQNSSEMKDFNSQTGSQVMSQPTQENSITNNSNSEVMKEREITTANASTEAPANNQESINQNPKEMKEINQSASTEAQQVNDQQDQVINQQNSNVMKKCIFSASELTAKNIKVARFVGNRVLNEKNIQAKMKSLETIGMQVPAVFVKATLALEKGLEAIDFTDESVKVTPENADNYIVLIEGNHRYKAYLKLKLDSKRNPQGDFYFTEMLNIPENIVEAILNINTVTSPWKGGDYVNGATMMVKEKPELLLELNDLVSKGYSAEAASLWLTFTSIKLQVYKDAAKNGKVDEKLKNTRNIKYGKRLLAAAEKKFDVKLLKSRTFVEWLANKCMAAEDGTMEATITQLVSFINSLNSEKASEITGAKKSGSQSKQDIMHQMLTSEYEAFLYGASSTEETTDEVVSVEENVESVETPEVEVAADTSDATEVEAAA